MMDMLVTGTNKDILKISCDDFTLYISGSTENKKFRATNNNKNISAKLSVESQYDSFEVQTIDSYGNLEENSTEEMYPSFFEDGSYNIYLENETKSKFEIYHQDKEIRENIITRGKNVFGSFRFNGDIGYSTFIINKDSNEVLRFTIQVFPSKLDYMDDYNEILRDINNEITSIVFDFISKTFSNVELKDVEDQTNLEFIVILNNIFDNLIKALNRIEKYPKHGVITEYNKKDKNKAKKISTRETIKHLRKNHTSTKVIEMKKRTTLDIYENQYVKYMIKRIIKKVHSIKVHINKTKGNYNLYFNKLNLIESKLNNHLNMFYRDISDISSNKSMTLVFKMASGYKEVYYYYSLLSKGLDICTGLYDVSHKKLWNLYEIWCYLKIHTIIKELGYTSKDSSIIQTSSNGITLSLMQSRESKCIYENNRGNKIELWYNKPYYGLPTTNQRPDTVLCLKGDTTQDRVYIFDAKYRLYIDNKGVIGPMEEDINVMHRYRDSIVIKSNKKGYYRYETVGAYVMFPCSDEEKYKEHDFYKSIDKVNIGALPMLPGSTSLMKKQICKIINESYIEASNNNPVFDEGDDYFKFKNKNVMVVNAKNEGHLEAYRKNRFYHIPKDNLSKLKIGIEYLAFYQPKSQFDEDCGIYYYAKIKDYSEYRRSDCSELVCDSDKKDKIYLRFELEEFIKVGPISTVEFGLRGIYYTTLFLLKNASTIHELFMNSRREIDVYKVLKKISDEKSMKLKKEKDKFCIGKDYIRVLDNGKIKFNEEIISLDELIDYNKL